MNGALDCTAEPADVRFVNPKQTLLRPIFSAVRHMARVFYLLIRYAPASETTSIIFSLEAGMAVRNLAVAAFVVGSLLSHQAFAVPDASLNSAARQEVVQTLATKLKANYVLPDVAERVAAAIVKKNADGGYAAATSAQAFSAALSKDLRELSKDKHFRTDHDERFRERSDDGFPTRAEMEAIRDRMAQRGYGIEKVERLMGNVGYIDLRGFGPTEFVGPAYTAAISLLSGTDALILDLRRNGGGRPASVAYLMSHFFPMGDERHLNDLYDRPTNTTQQYWTNPAITQRYDKPVYVLTSARTFSGGEECAYDFQTQKRATLVGETTGGGANPVGP
ncbi:S41 family peptidase [Massilia sp. Mn16-1_5]|uniref:S41 family peptidase n=1 Tax=Massilia sp. Mn16-1_5 TaxID=2079199 RepID=UPI001445ABA3|nr:S41 family peptidase [Massilia sp. Mn16-1_5]